MESAKSALPIDELGWNQFSQFGALEFGEAHLKNPEFERVLKTFAANTDRMQMLISTLGLCTWLRGKFQLCHDIAKLRESENLDLSDDWRSERHDINETTFKLFAEAIEIRRAQVDKRKTGDAQKDKYIDAAEGSRILSEEMLVPVIIQWDNSGKLRSGLEHIIGTSVTIAWTAFETMSEELWEVSLNLRPNLLMVIGNKSQYSFKKLRTIREAYAAIFPDNVGGIGKVVNNDVFGRLSTLRNVIVHNGTICDNEYLAALARIPELPECQEAGQKIKIDGGYARKLLVESYYQGQLLIQLVDIWIADH